MDSYAIGRRIQQARHMLGITQEELAQRLNLTSKYISNIECGEKTAKLETFVAIANALSTDANTLLQDVLESLPEVIGDDLLSEIDDLPAQDRTRLIRVIKAYIAQDQPIQT